MLKTCYTLTNILETFVKDFTTLERIKKNINMTIYTKTYDLSKVKTIPEDTYQWCLRNNFNSGLKSDHGNISSSMRAWLVECFKEGEGLLYIAHNRVKHLGWGITYNYHDGYRNSREFQVYVPPRNRRRGIGTKLLSKACSQSGRVKVYAHSVSEDFYMANGLTEGEAITGKRLKKNSKRKPLQMKKNHISYSHDS